VAKKSLKTILTITKRDSAAKHRVLMLMKSDQKRFDNETTHAAVDGIDYVLVSANLCLNT